MYQGHRDQHFGCVTYAQHGEDLMLLNLFSLLDIDVKSNAWLDLGAHHPTTISNTRLLYERGFRGVNVEANPGLIEAFLKERPEDVNVNIGVGLKADREAPFYMYSDTSGRNTFSPDEVKSLEGVMSVKQEISLPVLPIDAIVSQCCGGVYPILLSCDIEGLDYDVLASADFSKNYPTIIVVETRRDDAIRMVSMMNGKFYSLLCRMGENLIFIHLDSYLKVF